jgi:enamine deaminase RidA (YjgF/YER057c/UK114 family)
MARERFFTGSRFEERGGYARGVRDDDMVFMSGCVGFDYVNDTISDDVVKQTHQAFRNINWGLKELHASFDDVVRIVIYIADRSYYEQTVDVIGEYCRDVRPANTFIIAQLVDPRMKIEIEVTTRDRQGDA